MNCNSRQYEYLFNHQWPFVYAFPKFRSIKEIDIKKIITRESMENPKPGEENLDK